jgi:hypothetical protein
VEGTHDHMHSYSAMSAADGWEWCKRGECYVTDKCDHRRWPCRDRSIQVETERLNKLSEL